MDETAQKVLELSGLKELNPVQKLAIDNGLLEGKNMVVAAPTASGKTLVAEIAMLKTIKKGKKAVYIVPLKALASEKHEEFKSKYEALGIKVAISVGDLDAADPWLSKYDLIVVTSEKLDSLMRHGIEWVDSIGLVIVDEIHLLNDLERGPTLEVTLTKLRQLVNPWFLGLSATISNYEQLAEWLDAVGVKSDYRPVKLSKGVCFDKKIHFQEGVETELDSKTSDSSLDEIISKTISIGKQTMVFVSTRKSAEALAEKLGNIFYERVGQKEREKLERLSKEILNSLEHPTMQCKKLSEYVKKSVAFHHAGAVSRQRKLIENAFKEGLIRVITATPTLAMGVNLPSYQVVIRDLKRFYSFKGSDYLPALEIEQMCLPAGEKVLMADCTYKNIEDIKSGDVVISCDKNYVLRKSIVTNVFYRESKDFVELKTDSGKTIMSTSEHPFLSICGNNIDWKPANKIAVGDMVAVVGKFKNDTVTPLFFDYIGDGIYVKKPKYVVRNMLKIGNLTYGSAAKVLSIPFKTMKEYGYRKSVPLGVLKKLAKECNIESSLPNMLENMEFKTKYGSTLIIPKHITQDFMWFLGMISAEGSLVCYRGKGKWKNIEYKKLKISNTSKNIIRKLTSVLDSFGISYYQADVISGFGSKVVAMDVTNQALVHILERIGLSSMKSAEKSVPVAIFRFNSDLIAGYLAGIFDGDGSIDRERCLIRLSSQSRDLLSGCQSLLLRFGISSTINKEHNTNTLAIHRKDSFNAFLDTIPCIRLTSKKRKYIRETRPQIRKGDIVFEKVDNVVVITKKQKVYNMEVEGMENFICNNFIVHNCGRAGRPKYDSYGVAVLMAKTKAEAEYAWENYILGEPEDITSKLGVEPILRMHALGLIASGITPGKKELFDFFSKTFYAFQYGDMSSINNILDKILEQLKGFNFITIEHENADEKNPFRKVSEIQKENPKLSPTKIGKRVSELYIDPLTAFEIIKALEFANKQRVSHFGYLHIISNTIEMRPLISARKRDTEIINNLIAEEGNNLAKKPPNPWDWEYEDFIDSLKTAYILDCWTRERGEDRLFEEFNVTPGELRARLDIADWLLYATSELALLLGFMEILKYIKKTRVRVQYGVKEELLPLIRLKGIGRVRARKLYNAGLKDLGDLRKAEFPVLEKIVGGKIALEIRKQLGNDIKGD